MKRWYRAINPVWEQSQREVFDRTFHNSIIPSSESSDADAWEGFLAAKFLQTDLALCSLPVLPDVTSMHNDTLQGCYIVQVLSLALYKYAQDIHLSHLSFIQGCHDHQHWR